MKLMQVENHAKYDQVMVLNYFNKCIKTSIDCLIIFLGIAWVINNIPKKIEMIVRLDFNYTYILVFSKDIY